MNIKAIVSELRDAKGYVVFPELITGDRAQEARNLILALAGQERQTGKLITQQGRWRLRLVGRGDIFMELGSHDLVHQVASAMLGEDFVMGGLSAHAIPTDAPPQGVHVDYPYSVMTEPFPETPMQLQAIWVLDAFTPESGPTRIVPASQKTRRRPDLQQFHASSVPILCPAGSLILSHGGLWHDSSTNRTSETRIAILGNYTPFWVRSVEGFPETIKSPDFTPAQRKRLGFNIREAMTKALAWKRESKDASKPPY